MATTVMLVRHAEHALQGRALVGRTPGIGLAPAGRAQAVALATHPGLAGLDLVQAGPLERAQQTAAALGRPVETAAALDEIDFGVWTGRTFAALADDPQWRLWNAARASARAPGGESMREVQARVVGHLERLAAERPDGRIALVSHGDVIKAAVAYLLGCSLDFILRFEVAPASISTIVVGDWGGKVVGLNERIAA